MARISRGFGGDERTSQPRIGWTSSGRIVTRQSPTVAARSLRRSVGTLAAVGLLGGMLSLSGPAFTTVAPVGQGFALNTADVAFILSQIKIAERHTRAFEGTEPGVPANPNPAADPTYCLSMVGPAVDQIPDALTTYGLRTTDGSCNNISNVLSLTNANNNHPTPTFDNRPTIGAADQPFPRLTNPVFRDAEEISPTFPVGPLGPTSYTQKLAGNVVVDSQPRLVSNLVVDQTSSNPAAVLAAGNPVRTQGNPGVVPCTVDSGTGLDLQPLEPFGCTPQHQTLFIPNVTTDVGLSPPYNSLFTFFGQFFDHGVDQTVKGGGTVFVPLRADDPLVTHGPDGIAGNGDEVPPSRRFMALTRAQSQPGPDGVAGTADDVQNANNTDTPWVDNSQTYTSHSSHQVFLREYALDGAGHPQPTGRLLGGLNAGETYNGSPDARTGMSTWASTKRQAAQVLGLALADTDVTNIPMLATDPYGGFIPGPNGLPQYVCNGQCVIGGNPVGIGNTVEGNLLSPVPVPSNVVHFDTPFLTDIAHNADPSGVDVDHNPGTPDVFPAPDADDTPSANFATQAPGTYDNEMLDAHFTCGDGRCNENIALSTIHQVFHSEHNRLIDEVKSLLVNDTSPTGVAALQEWQTASVFGGVGADGWNGGRLFQAARLVNEMEYQHAVFEEFARKVQPLVRLFHVYSPDINPATTAEFAHAVYRFGHSMLDDDVARVSTKSDGTTVPNSLPLLTAFLNPPEFFNNSVDPTHPVYTPEEAAGAIVMGSSDQVGNEIDEFTTEVLRNNLLGLPLDLPTLNITRARSEGIPPLNDVRRQIHAVSNDGQLAPYTSWFDFGQHLRHPESLINFVAAYGTHPTVRDSGVNGLLGDGDDVTTIAAKRAAARAIVDPLPTDVQPVDAAQFMFSTGDWESPVSGVTTTGLDTVDLWSGGLAEITNVFGGLLGSTFNYVFQTQLESLQDGDRLYYLARTPGLNLRTQLEGNSFAELIQRNTDGTHTLKADAFATADCKFELANLAGTPAGFNSFGPTVADDPTTECQENLVLFRQPNGTIQYRAVNSVDPPGINGQAVYNGTAGVDRINGGNDNDTFWGGDGNDVIEGNGGDDVALGGNGDDIITDLSGADVPKGGPGNDAIDGGIDDDIVMGGTGNDFMNGGSGDNETFSGAGNDWVIAGQGADAVFGDSGDDWIEGGSGQDLLQGDHGAPFFDDPGQTAPGNEIMIGQVGENDYDAEGGDDLMAQNAAVDRNAGGGGFDWAFHQYNTTAADDDMNVNRQLAGLPIQIVVNRDRWQETEAISGDRFDDVIRGTTDAGVLGGGGFSGCDALDQAGVDRIAGLNRYITTFPTSLAAVRAAAVRRACPLQASSPGALTGLGDPDGVWAEGNILLGGGGNDVLEGRGNNDILDGDHTLHVRISVRENADGSGAELGTTDLMEHAALGGTFGPGTAGMTLQAAVFAGKVNPGQLVAVREIVAQNGAAVGASPDTATAGDCGPISPTTHVVSLAGAANCDTAAFSAPANQYTITNNADGSSTVAFNGAVPFGNDDGIDTLWNIENLRFCLGTDPVTRLCNSFQDVPITGVPLPAATFAPASLAFGGQAVGGTTAAQSITVGNTGNAALDVTSVTVTGADATSFAATNGCVSVAPSATCTVSVTFSPASGGAKTASVTIVSNDPTSPTFTVPLSGTGLAPAIAIAPATVAFANQVTGTSSAAQTVTVSNAGTASLVVSAVTVGGADGASFSVTNGCGAAVAPAGTCAITAVFAPTTNGAKTATVTIVSNDPATPTRTVNLTGTGTPPPLTLAPNALAFASQAVGSAASALQNIVLTNTSAGPVTTTSATVSGPNADQFVVTFPAGCVRTRSAGIAFCTIGVRFRPTVASGGGTKNAQIVVTSNVGTFTASLTGTAVAVPTINTVATVNVGRRPLNSTTTTTVLVTNTGGAPLTISSIATTGSAAYSATIGTCNAPIGVGGSCQLIVTFRPTAAGNPITGTLTIVSDATNTPTRTVALTGRAP